MQKQHIADRLSEMLGVRVSVGLFSDIEDIFGYEPYEAGDFTETQEDEQALLEDGSPAVDDQGQPIMGKKRTIVHVFKPMVRKKKIDERRIDHGEQYAYTDAVGQQVFVSAELIAQAVAYLEANPPTADPVFTNYENLRERMTPDERRAILTARRADWRVDDFVTWASSVGDRIDLMGKNVAEARAALVAAGVLTEERAVEIFAP